MPLICPSCKGKKQVAPLGGITKDCAYCKGIGWVSQESNKDETLKTFDSLQSSAVKMDKRSKEYRALKLAKKA